MKHYDNGDRYVGQLVNDKCHGRGTFYYSNGSQEAGTWENDQFVG